MKQLQRVANALVASAVLFGSLPILGCGGGPSQSSIKKDEAAAKQREPEFNPDMMKQKEKEKFFEGGAGKPGKK